MDVGVDDVSSHCVVEQLTIGIGGALLDERPVAFFCVIKVFGRITFLRPVLQRTH